MEIAHPSPQFNSLESPVFQGSLSLPFPYLYQVLQIFISGMFVCVWSGGGGGFRELGLLGLYLRDPHFVGLVWLRKPVSREIPSQCTCSSSSPSPLSIQFHT